MDIDTAKVLAFKVVPADLAKAEYDGFFLLLERAMRAWVRGRREGAAASDIDASREANHALRRNWPGVSVSALRELGDACIELGQSRGPLIAWLKTGLPVELTSAAQRKAS